MLYWLSLWLFILDGHAASLTPSPQAVLQKILNASSNPSAEGYCRPDQKSPLPKELLAIQAQLKLNAILDPKWMRSQWSLNSITGRQAALEIDSSSKYYQELKQAGITLNGLEKPTHFAGGDLNRYGIPSQQSSLFFSHLFSEVAQSAQKWNPITLSRWDLFHGHMVYDSSSADLLIIFHAKEYPIGNPALCDSCPLKALFQRVRELPSSLVRLDPPSLAYQRRNFVWSLKKRKICGVNTMLPPYSILAQEDGDSATLDEGKVSLLGEDGEILNVDEFSREGVPVFFEFHKGFGISD